MKIHLALLHGEISSQTCSLWDFNPGKHASLDGWIYIHVLIESR